MFKVKNKKHQNDVNDVLVFLSSTLKILCTFFVALSLLTLSKQMLSGCGLILYFFCFSTTMGLVFICLDNYARLKRP